MVLDFQNICAEPSQRILAIVALVLALGLLTYAASSLIFKMVSVFRAGYDAEKKHSGKTKARKALLYNALIFWYPIWVSLAIAIFVVWLGIPIVRTVLNLLTEC
jgi:hypothetical protein